MTEHAAYAVALITTFLVNVPFGSRRRLRALAVIPADLLSERPPEA